VTLWDFIEDADLGCSMHFRLQRVLVIFCIGIASAVSVCSRPRVPGWPSREVRCNQFTNAGRGGGEQVNTAAATCDCEGKRVLYENKGRFIHLGRKDRTGIRQKRKRHSCEVLLLALSQALVFSSHVGWLATGQGRILCLYPCSCPVTIRQSGRISPYLPESGLPLQN
jgi:hypothetical protein